MSKLGRVSYLSGDLQHETAVQLSLTNCCTEVTAKLNKALLTKAKQKPKVAEYFRCRSQDGLGCLDYLGFGDQDEDRQGFKPFTAKQTP